jgi:transcriptional regulator with XRE-family HTH domain
MNGEMSGEGTVGRGDERTDGRTVATREPLWRDVVGEVLREERQAKQRTLQDVADAARISMPYLSEIERGRKEASSEVLAAATRALGLSMTELLERVQVRLGEHEQAAAKAAYAWGSRYARAAVGAAGRDALCLAA